jgi:hypothetical protein
MLDKLVKRLERREWAKRQQQAVAEYESVELPALAADAAVVLQEEARVACAVHNWAPKLRPGAPIPPSSMCPLCQEEAAIRRPGGPDVYLIGPGNGIPVADPYAERWERWQQEHPADPSSPQPGSWEEREALEQITEARWDREAGIERVERVYLSQDGTRSHHAKRRRPKPAVTRAMAAEAADFWS